MKKYLMMGIAILALASCTKHDIEYVNPDVVKYEQVFTERFGTPSPTHTWGFGSGITRTAYPNANQWASQGYNVPDRLSDGQKARVQFYFQTNKITNPVNEDFHQIDFFMQQVYDGCTDAITKYSDLGYASPTYSAEEYDAASGTSKIQSGEHMDHLTAGSDHEHVYNFNNGTCSTNPNVGDNGAALDTKQHSDEIMLMLNTKTDVFGYANSDASFVRDDRYVLVSGADIDAYITQNKAAYDTWLAKHEGVEDAIVDDDWHRSFIGFDFDMIPDNYVFAGDKTWENGKITAITYSYFSKWLGNNTLVWNGSAYVEASTLGEVVNEGTEDNPGYRFYPYMPGTTDKVKMLNAESNQYCGTKQPDWGDDKWEIDYRYKDDQGVEQYGGKRIRVDYMIEALRGGYLPDSSSDKKWYKIGGCADGYYSDWIVSFLPATRAQQETYDIRVMAEDLSTNENSDFDFNDIVFDVKWISDGEAEIKILAAGGIYPIYVELPENEAHKALTGTTGNYTMLNTYAGRHNEYTAQPFTVTGDFGRNAANIKVYVQKPGQAPQLLTAERGKVASKIGVPTSVDWCDEFQDIEEKWGSNKFAAWVENENNKFWE
jgi:hypothetical protein